MVKKSRAEVGKFLDKLKELISEDESNIQIVEKSRDKTDKTKAFRLETGYNKSDIINELLKLDICNYSYTDKDRNPKFSGEVWIFGSYIEEIRIEAYIKLKKRKKVICLSFHEKEYELFYPYL